jgi:hypothetical protein
LNFLFSFVSGSIFQTHLFIYFFKNFDKHILNFIISFLLDFTQTLIKFSYLKWILEMWNPTIWIENSFWGTRLIVFTFLNFLQAWSWCILSFRFEGELMNFLFEIFDFRHMLLGNCLHLSIQNWRHWICSILGHDFSMRPMAIKNRKKPVKRFGSFRKTFDNFKWILIYFRS